MIKKDFKTHSVIYETQWPRLMELQKHFMRACELEPSIFTRWFRKDFAVRTAAHRQKINEHFLWIMRQQFGENVQWVSMYVPHKGFLKNSKRGTGYNGEVLQFLFWFDDD
jgi:hypothetical protein